MCTRQVESFRRLLTSEGRRALAAATELAGEDPVRAVPALRRRFDPELAGSALSQVRLRARAREKFGADADRMYFTPDGLEQATRKDVAGHRAARFPAHARVADLCCGIGGDLIELARRGCAVHAVDADPLTAEMARANVAALGLDAEVRTADASSVDPAAYHSIFIDPSRRRDGRRVFDPGAYSPPWPVVAGLLTENACVKVAPGIPHELVPSGVEAEWVSVKGEVKEVALWSGSLASGPARRATLLPGGESLRGEGAEPGIGPPGRYLYEPDGAVVRAGLVAEAAEQIGGRLLDPRIAYITGDELARTPWARPYRIDEVVPFSVKRLRAALRDRGAGTVTLMKRGSAVDLDRLRRELRLSGENAAVVALTRIGAKPYAVICEG